MKIFFTTYVLLLFLLFALFVNILGESEQGVRYSKLLSILKLLGGVLGFFLSCAFLVLLIFLIISYKDIWKNLRIFSFRIILFLFLIFLLGLFLRLNFFYLKTGTDVMGMHLLYMLRDFHFTFFPFGKTAWVFMHKIFSLFTGTTLKGIFLPNIIFGSLTSVIIFVLTYLLFKRKMIAIVSTLLFAFSPIFLRISSTVSYTATAIFFSVLTFLFILLYISNLSNKKFFMIALLLLYITIQTRTEYIFLIPIFFLTLLTFSTKKDNNNLKNLLCLFLIFLVPYLLSMFIYYYYFTIDDLYVQGTSIDKENLINSLIQNWIRIGKENFFKNLEILISGKEILQLNIFFSVIGTIICLKKWKKQFIFLGSYFLIFFFAYTFLHSGGFFQYGGDYKYIPTLLPPIVILSSVGIFSIYQKLERKVKFLGLIFLLGILLLYGKFSLDKITIDITLANSELSPRTKEFRFFENRSLDVNTNCKVLMNGWTGIFPFYYDFKENPMVIKNLSHLEIKLENLNNESCYYFYQGYYTKEEDKKLGTSRIYDTERMINLLKENNFKQLFSYKIDKVDILLYERK